MEAFVRRPDRLHYGRRVSYRPSSTATASSRVPKSRVSDFSILRFPVIEDFSSQSLHDSRAREDRRCPQDAAMEPAFRRQDTMPNGAAEHNTD